MWTLYILWNRLLGQFFFVDNGKYCEAHKQVTTSDNWVQTRRVQWPTYTLQVGLGSCGKCGDYLDENSVVVAGNSYHPKCFLCSECQAPIIGKFYSSQDGRFVSFHLFLLNSELHLSVGCVKMTGGWSSQDVACVIFPYWTGSSVLWTGSITPRVSRVSCVTRVWTGDSLWRTQRQNLSYVEAAMWPTRLLCVTNAIRQLYRNQVTPFLKFRSTDSFLVCVSGKRVTVVTCNGNKYHHKCYTCKVWSKQLNFSRVTKILLQRCETNLNGKQVFLENSNIVCQDCAGK